MREVMGHRPIANHINEDIDAVDRQGKNNSHATIDIQLFEKLANYAADSSLQQK